jgi:hypothetical protein
MIILAIDPGPIESAYALWDGEKILAHGKRPNGDLAAPEFRSKNQADFVAIECVSSYGMAVGSEVFETCRWEGKFELLFTNVVRVRRRDVKSHLCETTTAKDKDVIAALTDRLGTKGTAKAPGPTFGVAGDVWAALAVAVFKWDELAKAGVK